MGVNDSSDTFWVTFAGEYCELLCKYETSERMPLVIQAHLVDMDKEYYYLGDNPIEVDSAVKRADVAFISVIKPKNPAIEMLEEMPEPKNEEDVN